MYSKCLLTKIGLASDCVTGVKVIVEDAVHIEEELKTGSTLNI